MDRAARAYQPPCGSAAAQVLSSAQALATESNRLKSEVEKFLHTVRAA